MAIFITQFFICLSFIIPIYTQDLDCLCSGVDGEFAMVCVNSTCAWDWCGCSDKEYPCQSDSVCPEVTCLCSIPINYKVSDFECTVTIKNNWINCKRCDDVSLIHRDTVHSFAGALKKNLGYGNVYKTSSKFSTPYYNGMIYSYKILKKNPDALLYLSVFGLRRAIQCQKDLLDTCASEIREALCLAKPMETTTTAPPPPVPCYDQTPLLAGLFFAGFIAAIVLLWIFFILYNFIKRRRKQTG